MTPPLGALPGLLARIPFDPRHLPQLPDDFPPGVREALLTLALALPAAVAVAADAIARRQAARGADARGADGRGADAPSDAT